MKTQTAVDFSIEEVECRRLMTKELRASFQETIEMEKQQCYSDVEVLNMLLNCPTNTEKETIEWFEQFKKK